MIIEFRIWKWNKELEQNKRTIRTRLKTQTTDAREQKEKTTITTIETGIWTKGEGNTVVVKAIILVQAEVIAEG